MPLTWREPETRRLTPFARSVLGAALVLLVALFYLNFVGLWVADAETRAKFQALDPQEVSWVTIHDVGLDYRFESVRNEELVEAIVQGLRKAKSRLGYKPSASGGKAFLRFELSNDDGQENLTLFYPMGGLRDRFGPDVAFATESLRGMGHPN